jgi:hypothetical protein
VPYRKRSGRARIRYTTRITKQTPSNALPDWQRAGYWCGPKIAEPSNHGDDSVDDRFGNGSLEGTAAIKRDHHEKMAALYAERDRELQDKWRCGK